MHLKHLQELTQLSEAAGGFFTEAKAYSDAGEFSDEFYDLFAQVTKMKKVMKNEKWLNYMKLVDFSQSTSTESYGREAIRAIVALEAALQSIDKELDRIAGHDDAGTSATDDDLPNDGLDAIEDDERGSRGR